MNAGDLIDDLERLGVQLWVDDGQLRFRAPKGVLTPDRIALLRGHKSELLAHLGGSGVTADPGARHEPFPLTDVQSAYLLGRHDAFAYGGVACHGYFEVAFGDLDPGRLTAAWQALIDRHDMLRAVISEDGHQRVLPGPFTYDIRVDDLRAATAEEVDAAIAATREDLEHQVHDPGTWPLFDLRVTRTPGRDLLHVSIDLLIADYASIQLLLAELDHRYSQPFADLPTLDLTFRDFLLAERARHDTPAYEAHRDWWHDRLDTLPPAPELPLDGNGSAKTFTRWQTRLDRDRWDALRKQATGRDLTPTTALLAAYTEVIEAWSRRPSFTLNLTLMHRPPLHPQVGRLVGDFTSVTLLAVEPVTGTEFATRAAALQRQLWADLDHRDYSGVEVVRELARRKGGDAALMPIVFTSTVGLAEDAGTFIGTGDLVYGLSQTPQVFIDCQVMEHHGDLLVNWDVRDGVFPPGLIDDMFAAYSGLLIRLADDAECWAHARPIALPEAQARRRATVNATATDVPAGLLHEPVFAQAARTPDRPAVITSATTLTYRELAGRAADVARTLDGLEPGEPVAVVMDKGWEQVVAVLGILLAGGAYVPIDTNQPPARRDVMLRGIRYVLNGLDNLYVQNHAPAPTDGLAYVIYTSGSTGTPKGVMIDHRGALNTVVDINTRFGVHGGDRVLGLANLGFDLSVYDIFGPLAVGAALVLPDADRRGDPSHWAELAAAYDVTVWNSVPAQMQMLTDYLTAAPGAARPPLRLALLSGDWIPVPLPDTVRGLLPLTEVISLGGATEASIWSIAYPTEEVPAGWPSIPYGLPLANQTVHVLRADLSPCPDWVPGELYIGGVGIALGYLGDEGRTAERFVTHAGERLYRTGDLGRYHPDGVIEFLGRDDDQVKIRGHRIELAEIETALLAHPAVGGAAVLVHGTRPLERRLEAIVEPAHRPAAAPVEAVRIAEAASSGAAAVVAGVDRPAVASFVDQLDRAALAAMLGALRAGGVFTDFSTVYATAEVLDAATVAPRHHRLARRWLRALAERGLLSSENGGWKLSQTVDDPDWDAVHAAAAAAGPHHGAELIRYLQTSAEHLPELLRDELDPLALLFPEGRLDVAEAAYRDNLISRYLNRAVAAALAAIADDQPAGRTLRVLEVGAGVGATTADLLDTLAGRSNKNCTVDYLFTDVSPFFLNEARERFGEYGFVRYGLFDLNTDLRAQGLRPNTVDVVVCANVLHNSRHAGRVLERLTELVRPGGWLLFIEATRDSYPLMASMEFKEGLTDFDDERRETESTFHTRQYWYDLLVAHGATVATVLPAVDDPLTAIGQHAFVVRLKTGRVPVAVEDLHEHLAARLPGYMLPAGIQVVDALPVTANGKVDRRAMAAWLDAAPSASGTTAGDPPRGDLEQRLAAVWTDLLGVDAVGRDQDFYAAGGDSLLAAQLVGRIRNGLTEARGQTWDVLLRQMLRAPTIAGFAAWLAEAPAAASVAERVSPLVRLTDGGDGPVRVLVHDGSGTIAPYRALVGLLSETGPVVGFSVNAADDLLRHDPDILIGQLAAGYAADLTAAVPGPYHIVGYCMGGLLATELARHLTETGHDVASVTVISSYRVPYLVEDDLLIEYAFAKILGVDPAILGYPADEEALGRALQAALATTPGRLVEGAFDHDPVFRDLAARPQDQRLAAIAAAAGGVESVDTAWQVFRHCLQAVTRHPADAYAGDLTFLRQAGGTHFLPGLREDMTAFWTDLCLGDLTVIDVPGNHFTCLQPPNVVTLATVLGTS